MVARRVPGPKNPAPKTTGDLTHERSNVKSGFAAGQLLSFVERYERLTEEISGLGEDRKEVMAEAKGTGFDTKIIRQIVAIRKMGLDQFNENEALKDLYLEAVRKAEAEKQERGGAELGEAQSE